MQWTQEDKYIWWNVTTRNWRSIKTVMSDKKDAIIMNELTAIPAKGTAKLVAWRIIKCNS